MLRPVLKASVLGLFCLGTASGTVWLYTTNDSDENENGHPGRRIAVGTYEDPVELASGDVEGVPCNTADATVPWATNDGKSLGINADWDVTTNDKLWASISIEQVAGSICTSGSNDCIGAARVDAGSVSVTRHLHPVADPTHPAVPDVLGDFPDAIVMEKDDPGTVWEWNVSTGNDQYEDTGIAEGSQMAWATSTYWLATEATQVGACATTGNNGRVALLKRNTSGKIGTVTVVNTPTADTYKTKPEGIDVVLLSGSQGAPCDADADYIIYVTDYCNSRLYVLNLDVSAEDLTNVHDVDLNTGSYSRDCNPNAVRYDEDSNALYVNCQTRGSVLRLDVPTADRCEPTFDSDDSFQLQRLTARTASPGCSADPPPATTDCDQYCEPHGMAIYRNSTYEDWLMIALHQKGQIVAARIADLDDQVTIFNRANSEGPPEGTQNARYRPRDLLLAKD